MVAQEMSRMSLPPGSYVRYVFAKEGERLRHGEQAVREDSLGCSRLTGIYHMNREQQPLTRV